MIVLIEGPRGSGKSHLVNDFFSTNTNSNVMYYKFAFSDYIKKLQIEDHESGPGVHYFSISNILTILGISTTFFKDKCVVFDRSIFSAYVWSIYRKRMSEDRLINEFSKILGDIEYNNCKVIYLTRDESISKVSRDKDDVFNVYENYHAENSIFKSIFSRFENDVNDSLRNNKLIEFVNKFNDDSKKEFKQLIENITSNI
tara:strand:- start:104 stop:703 length:600 start_codon:yes stop_codon:yes gene_type:complete